MKLNPNLISSTPSPPNTFIGGQQEEVLKGGGNMVKLITSAVDPDETNLKTVHFLDFVRETVRKNHGKTYASWYDIGGEQTASRSFGQIWETAGAIAYHLRCKWNVKKGERAILCYDFGLHFFEAFFGCLRAGVVAVLVYPPGPPLSKSLIKLDKVINDCEPALVLIDTNVWLGRLRDKFNIFSESRNLWPDHVESKVTDTISRSSGLSFDEKTADDEIAFLQYTSGSTGDPKGVMVTFKALGSNVDLIHHGKYQGYEADGEIPDEIVGFSWLPQYHDLGLIYAGIAPFAAGWRMHMMSPLTFIKNPLLWLELMSRHKVQWSVAPDFSFGLVTRKFQEAQARIQSGSNEQSPLPDLDLSGIRGLCSAAEPCRPQTQELFSQVFSPYGLREKWYSSGYGLAENVVGVAYVRGMHLSSPRQEDQSKLYVACASLSQLYPSLILKIVDPETCTEVEGDATGELWIAGPTVAAGYYGKRELSQQTFKAQLSGMPGVNFLRTGDLGFFQSGQMYICGRIKDLIIVNGVNHYPQDLEFAAQNASNAVRPGCVAAFASNEIEDGSSVEVVFEIRSQHAGEAEQVCSNVRSAVARATGIPIGCVVAISERTIPKTTSGKIQRRATRMALHNGHLNVVHTSKMEESTIEEQVVLDAAAVENLPTDSLASAGGLKSHGFASIVASILGTNINEESTWEDLGLSSMAAVELQSQISEKLLVTLPPTFQDDYPTPRLLREFVEGHNRKPLPVSLPALTGEQQTAKAQLGWNTSGACQFVGVVLLLLAISFSFVPAYHFGKLLASIPSLNHATDRIKWQWLPLVLPFWMLSFSLLVVVVKWVVIGRYKAQQFPVPSVQFLRWWFVDRLVHVWEIWIGNLVVDTPVIWLFYLLLGARLHPLAQIDAFIREFDLVEIGADSKLEYGISCRRFSTWDSEHGLSLHFRPIRIGSQCKIQGLVGLGASVGDGSHVDRLSAIAEGAQVPESTHVQGSPAYNNGSMKRAGTDDTASSVTRQLLFASFKILCLLVELYLFFTFLLFGQWLLNGRLPLDFRYTPLLYWTLQLLNSTVLNMLTCVLFKWLFIGKKRPGPARSSLFSEAADWAVDYHYKLSLIVLDTIAENAKLVNIYLMALGMDIDLASHVWAVHCPPSKVDLLSVRRCMFSSGAFDPKQRKHYDMIQAVDSSFGHHVVLRGGSKVSSSQIAPYSIVNGGVDGKLQQASTLSASFSCDAFSVALVLVIFWSAVPAYELFQLDSGDPLNIGFSVTKFALVLVVQTATWLFLFGLLQRSVLRQNKEGGWEPRFRGLYDVYLTVAFFLLERWSLLTLVYGTPLVNGYFKCLGTKIEGRMLYIANSCYEFPLLTFADRTVMDSCVISGHSVSAAGVQLGPSKCAGTMHEGIVVLAHTDLTGIAETGPCRFVVQNTKPDGDIDETGREITEFVGCTEQEQNEYSPGLVVPYGVDDDQP